MFQRCIWPLRHCSAAAELGCSHSSTRCTRCLAPDLQAYNGLAANTALYTVAAGSSTVGFVGGATSAYNTSTGSSTTVLITSDAGGAARMQHATARRRSG